ncbi:hypothetical protein SLEP1_g4062 [Rubroshorea leprosula]|uniref:Cytokinin dehydrogenase 1 FAD/cytokinin binding domain-containing protein n=1 Tax=Rubroshorea leprosula TaxID=152421 RepID=A0AAV5HMH3_9ROSI|nr:hypothetical protein SLEP1_g4062 [Rubroshorea leprosula]
MLERVFQVPTEKILVSEDLLRLDPSSVLLQSELQKHSSFYRWDRRSSAVTPEEDVFYLVALLRSALDDREEIHSLEYLKKQNREILRFCNDAGIRVKQYLPHYTSQEEWMEHFGDGWDRFYQRKMEFDPRKILATGQQIFRPNYLTSSTMAS